MAKAILAAIAAFIASGACLANKVVPTLEIQSLQIEVTWVSSRAELKRYRRQYGQPVVDTVIRTRLSGFSVLGKRDGEWVCLLFVQRPETMDDDHTLTLGHELAHCLLGAYH